jgi:hypothetical protein
MFTKRWSVAAVACVGLAAGCGGNEEDRVALVPVAGTVTFDGKPLAGVNIGFVPEPGNRPATDGGDITGPEGSFSARYRNRAGLAPGKYKVVVSRPSERGAAGKGKIPAEIAESPYMASLAAEAAGKKGGKAPKPWPYGDANSTPLSHEVSPKGDKGLEFDLKSSAK